MTIASARRMLAVFVPGWILDDRSLAPPAVGDLVETPLTFGEAEAPSASYAQTFRATARPAYGRMPGSDPARGLRWLHELSGDGWPCSWWADRPTTGRVEVRGTPFADLIMGPTVLRRCAGAYGGCVWSVNCSNGRRPASAASGAASV
ncbi:hypothetical protein GS473_01920 [Rhodococcus hoagii]|nr:hypothetical protein [Prescottella equi]